MQSTDARGFRLALAGFGVLVCVVVTLGRPAVAAAHGPIDPAASSYQAQVTQVPEGTDARAVDGDLRLWLRVDPTASVVVLDYRGAPYLRFDRAGVSVNESSSMYYLNQVPAEIPPIGLGPRTPARWHPVSSGHSYEWHDGRLHALATVAHGPGSAELGRWTVPLRVGGAPTAVVGSLRFAPAPSLVWFWPIAVVLACVFAGLRLRRDELDRGLARGLAAGALGAFVVAALVRQLHGRPGIGVGSLVVLGFELAFAVWATVRLLRGPAGWFQFFAIAAAAIWEGATLVGVLRDGFVLLAGPPLLGRIAVATCLALGLGLVPVVIAIAERSSRPRAARAPAGRAAA
ncbi:MAG: hypothetical protein JOZ07_11015 [Solirubrobacterales bacterium]|nr:hypothetical protein [Solirubrobacterales bacterium]